MASLPVNNNLNALTNIVNQANVSDIQNVSKAGQEETGKDSFGMVMNRVNGQVNNTVDTSASKASVTAAGKAMAASVVSTDYAGLKAVGTSETADSGKSVVSGKDAAERTDGNTKEKNVSEKDVSEKDVSEKEVSEKEVSEKEVSEEDVSVSKEEAVAKAGEKLVEDVAEELNITPEEVEEVMEILGLSAMQLLDPDNMKQLLLAISGNEDQLSIVTDGELYGHLQNLLEMAEVTLDDLQTQLGLSEEDLNALIADMAVVETEPEDMDVTEELLTGPEEAEEANLEGMKDYAVTVHRDGETVEVKVTVDDVSGDTSVKEAVTGPSGTQKVSENKSDSKDSSGESKGEGNFTMQTPVEQPNVSELSQQQPVAERFVNTEDIMNQIMEYMKINLKGDVQELELQLHPASLGTVNVQIAAKDGMITAQFTAQNETVKAAIESQLVQLKTQFEEQGIKVDEVEVAVGNYRYEQNYSGQDENPGENKGDGKKSRRRINLNELDLEELPEDMDDSERISAEMMAASGNTVDYTA